MKILLTGGAGFIGSAVVRYLLANTDHAVVNVDALTYAGNLESLPGASQHPRYHFEPVDICNGEALSALFSQYQPDAVMHLAAESHVDRSIDGPDAFIHTNLVGTYTLLEAARHYWLKCQPHERNAFRFLHVSTDEVFGDLVDVGGYFTEQTPYAPSSPYSASKAGSDHLVRAWHRTYGLPIMVTNCSNNYGPYQFPEKLIPHMILNALESKPLPVYGNGGQVRDWLYVEDHVRALLAVLEGGQPGETYAIGGHNEQTNLSVVEQLCVLLDELVPQYRPVSIQAGNSFSGLITFVADRPGHDRRYAVDSRKIQQQLAWQPQETFATGLRKTVLWYLDNELWWRRVLSGEYQLSRQGDALLHQ